MSVKRITLADVAREAGVSVQTASHVLSGNMTVRLPDRTRENVRAAAEKVGYRPNRLAQAMKRGKTHVVGIWMPVDRPIITYLRFLNSLNDQALASGYELMITGISARMAYAGDGRPPMTWPVDGLIAIDAGKAVKAFREDKQNDGTPVIVLGMENYVNSDSVGWDVMGASRQITERLIQRGCRRIVHLTTQWVYDEYPREQRRRGYTEAMTAAGLEPIILTSPDETSTAAAIAVESYVRAHGVPDGFTCFTDPLAMGVSRAIHNEGLRVPEDCRIWGFGDFPGAEDHRVPIATVQMPVPEIVDQAWTWLLQRMDDQSLPGRDILIPMNVVHRASAGIEPGP